MNYEAFFKISYGIYIVSSMLDEKAVGYISNTVFQVTADPSRLAIACNTDNNSLKGILKSGFFTVSVLQQTAESALIQKFGYKSSRETDKFSGVMYKTGITGMPVVLDDTIAFFECEVEQTMVVGTHMLVTGKVLAAELINKYGEPLTYQYFREVKKGFSPKNAPTYIDKEKIEHGPVTDENTKGVYVCTNCGYVYDPSEGDPDGGIPPGTSFEDLPEDWICPVCGVGKASFLLMS